VPSQLLCSRPAGYLLALGPLLFISICDVWLQLFSHDQAYAINLAAVGTVAFGCTGREWGRDASGGLSPSTLWLCTGGTLYRVSHPSAGHESIHPECACTQTVTYTKVTLKWLREVQLPGSLEPLILTLLSLPP
jgi:hypothetical protein